MRIIAGERKGFTLKSPQGQHTRPTLGRVRESLFSILGDLVLDARVADFYAGAGALGLEALSRGAAHCLFVDNSHAAIQVLRENIAKLRYEDRSRVIAEDASRAVTKGFGAENLDLIFADPPYNTGVAAAILPCIAKLTLAPGAVIVLQCSPREAVPDHAGLLALTRTQIYGETALHFYRPASDCPVPQPA